MNPFQLIICVETNRKCESDKIYLDLALKYFFSSEIAMYKIKLEYIFMDGKGNYSSKRVNKEIQSKINKYTGDTKVLFAFDTDRFETNPEDKNFLEQAKREIERNEYYMSWFCHDIEEVFLSEKYVENKLQRARKFARSQIHWCQIEPKLKANKFSVGKSNILLVVENILQDI